MVRVPDTTGIVVGSTEAPPLPGGRGGSIDRVCLGRVLCCGRGEWLAREGRVHGTGGKLRNGISIFAKQHQLEERLMHSIINFANFQALSIATTLLHFIQA